MDSESLTVLRCVYPHLFKLIDFELFTEFPDDTLAHIQAQNASPVLFIVLILL
jgi:hypothetical protein